MYCRLTSPYILSDEESTTTEFDAQFSFNENTLFSSLNENKEQNIQFSTPPISRKSSSVGLDTTSGNFFLYLYILFFCFFEEILIIKIVRK